MDQTAVVQASPWDTFFSGLAGSANTLIDAYTQAEVMRLNQTNQPVQYQFGGMTGGTAGGMNGTVMIGFAIVVGLGLALLARRREKNDA